jgi:hypothetical protein
VSDGVLAEIRQAKQQGKSLRYFSVIKSQTIVEVNVAEVELEDDVRDYRLEL